jgi:hypothetical protein
MKKMIAVLLSAISLIGCASNMAWYNPSRSVAQAQADCLECKYEATKFGYVASNPWNDSSGTGIAPAIETVIRQNEIIGACMRAKGYTMTSNEQIIAQGGAVANVR